MPESISNFLSGPGLLILLMVAMFALMIIPQRRRDKKFKEMLSGVKVGDSIRTIGGFFGRVVQVKPDVITMECGPDHVKLVLKKSAVAAIENAEIESGESLGQTGDK